MTLEGQNSGLHLFDNKIHESDEFRMSALTKIIATHEIEVMYLPFRQVSFPSAQKAVTMAR
jgi:hypothetical protein